MGKYNSSGYGYKTKTSEFANDSMRVISVNDHDQLRFSMGNSLDTRPYSTQAAPNILVDNNMASERYSTINQVTQNSIISNKKPSGRKKLSKSSRNGNSITKRGGTTLRSIDDAPLSSIMTDYK